MTKVKTEYVTYNLKDGVRIGRRYVRGTGIDGEKITIPIHNVISIMEIKR